MHPKYRKFIINDFKLPKIVVDDPFFDIQYQLLKEYHFQEVFEFVERCIDDFGNIDLFFEEVNLLSNRMFNYVLESYENKFDAYRSKLYGKDYYQKAQSQYSKTLINPDAIDKRYIRIDIKEACFNVLKVLTSDLDEHATYPCLVHSFSEFDEPVRDYVSKSKRIRSYIFGSIQKQLIIHIEKHIIGLLINEINLPVVFKDCDEVVYHHTSDNLEVIEHVVHSSPFNNILRIEEFYFKSVDYGYVECHNDMVVFKGVPAHYFCEQYALYYSKPLENEYRIFNFENQPCMRL